MLVIRNVRTFSLVSRSMLMGITALVRSACGGVPEDTEASSNPQVQQAALLPDQCAPAPAAHTAAGGIVYHRYSSGKTWAAAKADCTAMGGRLAVPFNSASNSAIYSIIGSDLTYIGLKQASGQSSTSAGWQTPEGYSATYFNWSSGEPNDMDNVENDYQDRARMYTTGYWDDVACSQVSPYVCEFASPPLQCEGQHYDVQLNACVNGS